jgi:DNA-binding HxlR family transcriptional regulator
MKVRHSCPVLASINVLSGKWKVQAVWRRLRDRDLQTLFCPRHFRSSLATTLL